jgi:uncharacterized protein (TIGR00369 family)
VAEDAGAPAGFKRLPLSPEGVGDFNATAGPWYGRDEDGRLVGGFRVLRNHLNPLGMCHGGLLATFCDVLMPVAIAYQEEMETGMLPTVSLSLDYLAPTPAGAWVEGRPELLRRGRRLVFIQLVLFADGRATVRANGVFSVPSEGGPALPRRQLKAYLTAAG